MSIKAVQLAREPVGYYQETSLAAAKPCPGVGCLVMIQAEGQNLRYRIDGINPTATVGMLLQSGETHTLNVGHGRISDIKIIETAIGGILNVSSFR